MCWWGLVCFLWIFDIHKMIHLGFSPPKKIPLAFLWRPSKNRTFCFACSCDIMILRKSQQLVKMHFVRITSLSTTSEAPGWRVRGWLKAKENITASRMPQGSPRPSATWCTERLRLICCHWVWGIQRTSLVAQTWVLILARVTATKTFWGEEGWAQSQN